VIGSVATSWRATAFAQALDEHELDEARAADRTVREGGVREIPLPPARRPAPAEAGAPAEARAAHEAAAAGDDGSYAADDAGDPAEDDFGPEPALLLEVAERLKSLPRPTLAPDVRIVQRAQLIAAMEAELASPEARAGQLPEQRDRRGRKGIHRAPALGPLSRLNPRSRLTKGLAAGGLGVGVAASALGGAAAASSDALPGDSLYGFKRGMENLQLDLADDDAARGLVHLDHASTRMKEARRLMERARGGAELDHESMGEIRRALAGMRYDATEGHKLLSAAYERDGSIAPMRSLSSFSTNHRASWTHLRDRLPSQLSDVGEEVSSVFDSMDSDVGPLEGLIKESSKADSHDQGRGERRKGDGRTTPQPSSSSDSAGSTGSDGGDGRTDSSPGSDQGPGELIGGSGLLGSSGGSGTSSGRDSRERGRSGPDSDVTLPPIVPDVLPGLRGLSGDDRR
jgi:hypothetical protein